MKDKIKKVPKHLAIVMDGNGRWALERSLDRTKGHEAGVKSVRRITKFCAEVGIKYLTLYTFSEENWNRPKSEVLALMKLLVKSLGKELDSLIKNNVKFKAIGNLSRLDIFTKRKIKEAEKITDQNKGLNLNLAISYSGRQEIVDACNKMIKNKVGSITTHNFSKFLYTYGIPDPDLLIRTAGENRISNFLLWQIAYTEIYVSKVCWPDFDEDQLKIALIDYNLRVRKYGKLSNE